MERKEKNVSGTTTIADNTTVSAAVSGGDNVELDAQ